MYLMKFCLHYELLSLRFKHTTFSTIGLVVNCLEDFKKVKGTLVIVNTCTSLCSAD